MGRFWLFFRIIAIVVIVGWLGFQATKFVAFHGHEAAQWAVSFNQPKLANNLRTWSMKLRVLPPFNSMPEALSVGQVKAPEPVEELSIEERIKQWRTTVPGVAADLRAILYNGDIVAVVVAIILIVLLAFKGPRKSMVGGMFKWIGGAFSTPDKLLTSVGNVAVFILVAMVAYESFLGRGWGYVAQSSTQFIWLIIAGVGLWAATKKWGGTIGSFVVGIVAFLVIAVFVVSMANPGLNIKDPSLNLSLSGVKEFSSSMYAGWSDTAKTYFWLMITAIGCLGLSSFFKPKPTVAAKPDKKGH